MRAVKSVVEYKSFRKYLEDVFKAEKSETKNVTLAQFAKKFELSGPTLQMILSGRRSLTVANLHRMARVLNMKTNERMYFEALVLRDQADDAEIKRYYSSRLVTIGKEKSVTRVRVSNRKILSSWHLPAAFIYLLDFIKVQDAAAKQEMVKKFAKHLALTPAQTNFMLATLNEANEMGIKGEDNVHLSFERVASQIPQKDYVKDVLQECLRRAETHFADAKTFFRGFVFTISASDLESLRQDILGVMEKYMAIETTTDKTLIQAFASFFPIIDANT